MCVCAAAGREGCVRRQGVEHTLIDPSPSHVPHDNVKAHSEQGGSAITTQHSCSYRMCCRYSPSLLSVLPHLDCLHLCQPLPAGLQLCQGLTQLTLEQHHLQHIGGMRIRDGTRLVVDCVGWV